MCQTKVVREVPTMRAIASRMRLTGTGLALNVLCVKASSGVCRKLNSPAKQMMRPYTLPKVWKPKTLAA